MDAARRARWFTTACLAISACGQGAANQQNAAETAPAIPVRVTAVRSGEVNAVYSGTATFEAEREADVVAKVGGEILEIFVEEGDRVSSGQRLARLDRDRLRLEAEQIEARLHKLERDYQRNVELFEQGLVSSGAFESMRFDLEGLRAEHELARLQLGYTEIRAPIDGVIAERLIKRGNTISADTVVFRIVDLDPLLADLHVPEREFGKLDVVLPVSVRVDALPGATFGGRVARISPVIDPVTGTFKVSVQLEDRSGRLKPGMFGRIDIVYERRPDALLIPRVALLDEEQGPYVFVIDGGVARRRAVRSGLPIGVDIEITDGLSAGERVVVVGQHGLKDGAAIELVAD